MYAWGFAAGRAEGIGRAMGENSEEPESKPPKQAPQKTKAEDNPWYVLATLYGVPGLLLLLRVKCGRCPRACIHRPMRSC